MPDPPDVQICDHIDADQRRRAWEGHEKFGSTNFDASPLHLARMHYQESLDGCYYGRRAIDLLGHGPRGQQRIFVSGPYTADSREQVERNIIVARDASAELYRRGHWPFCPHQATALFEDLYPDIGYRTYIDACLGWLPVCHAILMLPDWQHSSGAREEHEAAERLKLTVYYDLSEVPDLRPQTRALAAGFSWNPDAP